MSQEQEGGGLTESPKTTNSKKLPDYMSGVLSAMLQKDPFHASCLFNIDIIEDVGDELKTAATDGLSRIWISRTFMLDLSVAERAAVTAHEVQHVIRLHAGPRAIEMIEHAARTKNLDRKFVASILNAAQDFVINADLDKAGYPIKTVIKEGYLSVQEFEEVLVDDFKPPDKKNPNLRRVGSLLDQGLKASVTGEELFHRFMSLIPVQPKSPNAGGGVGIIGLSGDIDWDKVGEGLKESGLSHSQMEAAVQVIVRAAVASSQGIGKLPGYASGLIEEYNEPSNNWRKTLRRFICAQSRDDTSYRRVSRRSTGDILRPGLFSEKMGEIAIIVDDSGSVSNDLLRQALGEMVSVANTVKPTGITVVVCDTRVSSVTRFKPGEEVAIKIGGRGGTNMAPAFEHIRESDMKPVCIICLTDGEMDFMTRREADVPVIFGICNPRFGKGEITVPWGTAINIELED